MTWAELRDLVDALPADSATKAAAAGDRDGRRWSQDTYIHAATYNLLALLVRVQWTAHLKGNPPDMGAMDPPALEADEAVREREAAAAAYSEAVLNAFSPNQPEVDPQELDYWQTKIRELEQQT
ncbi:hypothetical protein [Streptomyces sp. NPDC047097]|uniref:hypothetical protein n=1 Tax=Streptomyces sp. NPDC047097 TaxID=3155260 RepID=UPI0033D17375